MKKKIEQSSSVLPPHIQAHIKSADTLLDSMEHIVDEIGEAHDRLAREVPIQQIVSGLVAEAKRNALEMDSIAADIERIEAEATAQEKIEDAEDIEHQSSDDE